MVLICGIDEAGRGPVIGPMVMCGVCIAKDNEKMLVELGARDSKLMTPKQREACFKLLIKSVKSYHCVEISPAEIDVAVLAKDGENLNWLEARKAAEIINVLKPDEVILDCPSPNINAYTQFISKLLKCKVILKCAHHADRDFPVVSAASVIAKVTRDSEIEKLKAKIGLDFGSGYVADPKTKAFLEKYWNKHPAIFRHSWAPYKQLVAELKSHQEKLDSF